MRKVQDILKDHRRHVEHVASMPEIHALGSNWPKDPDDIAYLAALDRLRIWESLSWRGQPRGWEWTEEKVAAALEIKTLIGWPWTDDLRTMKRHWILPDAGPRASGKHRNATLAGELAIIDEIAARRAIADLESVETRFDDVYAVLQKKPWLENIESVSSPLDLPLMRVLMSGFAPLNSLDLYEETVEVLHLLLNFSRMSDEWEIYYLHCQPGANEQALKDEHEIREELASAYLELKVKFSEIFVFLEELMPASPPTVDADQDKPGFPIRENLINGIEFPYFAATCKKALEEGWRELIGEDIDPKRPSRNDWFFTTGGGPMLQI